MVWVDNGKIYLYEGDTGEFPVILNGDIRSDDILEFRIKENLDDDRCLFSRQYEGITGGDLIIEINQEISNLLKNNTDEDYKYYYGFKLRRVPEDTDTLLAIGEIIVKKGV